MGINDARGVPSTEDEGQGPSQANPSRPDSGSQETLRSEKKWSWLSGGIQGILLRTPNVAESLIHSRFYFLSLWEDSGKVVRAQGLEPAICLSVCCVALRMSPNLSGPPCPGR